MIKAVFDHEDNLVKCEHSTKIAWELIKSHFGIKNRHDMLEFCYAGFQKSFYAMLCQKMSVAAENGDELCKSIFNDAGKMIGKMIKALLPKVDSKLIEAGHLCIICVGSVWKSWKLLRPGFNEELSQHHIPFDLRLLKLKPDVSMAIGCCYMASDYLNVPIPRDYTQNYEIFYNFEGKKINESTT